MNWAHLGNALLYLVWFLTAWVILGGMVVVLGYFALLVWSMLAHGLG